MNKFSFTLCLFTCLLIICCQGPRDPNLNKSGEDEFKAHEVQREIDMDNQEFQDVIYVPIYSDIYVDKANQNSLLSATLSIRNTSYKDSLFISKIDYFNTEGQMVRSYVDNMIRLTPMGTLNYVIEKEDDSGGPGANFIVEISSKNKNVKPLIQAVMIGHTGNKGFAFSTDGYSIK